MRDESKYPQTPKGDFNTKCITLSFGEGRVRWLLKPPLPYFAFFHMGVKGSKTP